MKSTSARKLTHAPTGPDGDNTLAAWLRKQAKSLKALEAKGKRLKLDSLANAREQGRIFLKVKKRLADTPRRFEEWVAQSTDIGYSTALLWMDVAQNYGKVKSRLANSNPLELTVRRVRDAIRDERQAQGKGKPGSGKRRAATSPNKNHPFEGENVPPVVDKNSLSWILRERWALNKADPAFEPPQQSEENYAEAHHCFQQAKNPGSTYATVAQATGKDEGEVKRLLRGLNIDRVDAEWAELRRQAEDHATERQVANRRQVAHNHNEALQEPTTKRQQMPEMPTNGTPAQPTVNGTPKQITYFHHDCHNFQIDGNSLQCLDQQGQAVILVASKNQQMADLLGDALNDGLAAIAKAKLFESVKTPKGDKSVSQIAEDFCLSLADIRKYLRLLMLTDEEQQQVITGKLTMEDAYRLLTKRAEKEKRARMNTEATPNATKKSANNKRRAEK